ncbi:MAG: ROK family protein [Campylobacterota bacterium]|nr:ROK family protein [Campylobacterota bacterium]
MKLYIDYGGTNFRYLFDDGEVQSFSSEDVDLKEFLDDIIKNNPTISSISISFAGTVNGGKIIRSANTVTQNFDVKSYIEKEYNINLEIQNDLNCAALAEFNTLHVESLALFYIGTGFGSAFIDENRLILGSSNKSGELGHIPFKKSPFKCGCGRDDCLELYASGSGIKRWCAYYQIDEKYSRLDLLEKLNDEKATLIVENFYQTLAHAFHTTLNLFDFNNLVLGGSVGKNIKIKEFLEKEFLKSSFEREPLHVSLSTLEEGSLEGTKYLL